MAKKKKKKSGGTHMVKSHMRKVPGSSRRIRVKAHRAKN